eukprot:3322484-Alexandrium_andersonii.AAC.1
MAKRPGQQTLCCINDHPVTDTTSSSNCTSFRAIGCHSNPSSCAWKVDGVRNCESKSESAARANTEEH